jgi:cytochrome c-type biogenesis protein CcmH/NrfG
MLDAANKPAEAIAAVNQAIQKAPSRPELYRQAIPFLLRNHRVPQALQLLDTADRVLPDNPEIVQIRATTTELASKTEAARRR